ncbi:MAG: transposase, partial [Maritimibacter sp.]
MSSYLRPRIPGATVFFTVTLQQRGSDLLTRKIDALQAAIAMTRAERPFHMDAWVVMPDHLHMVWTLPEGDADYSTRWSVIKARFSR